MLATAMKSAGAPVLLAALGMPSLSAVLPASSRLLMSHGISTSTGRGDSSAVPAVPAPAYRHVAPAAMFSPARHQSTIPFSKFKTMDPNNHQYKTELVESIEPAHLDPTKLHQKAGYQAVQGMRRLFDWSTGYNEHSMTEAKWIQRFLFLETVAGVPGMCAGMLRHLKSLRTMQRDNGWISTLLDEAENERMHLLTFLEVRQPGFLFRSMVIVAQGVFFNTYFLAYLLAPKFCHSFVGYLEEEAVKTYTHALKDIDSGCLKHWKTTAAPEIATSYWKLEAGATMRDLILAVRADEAGHSHVNHTLSAIGNSDTNPFKHNSKQIG